MIDTFRTQERSRWKLMLRRCEDPRFPPYRYYGARGIKVCERWHTFDFYFRDIVKYLGTCPPGMSLDRVDNDGDYEPSNCRWTTTRINTQNKRGSRFLETPWGWMSLKDAADRSGIGYTTLLYRLDKRKLDSLDPRVWKSTTSSTADPATASLS